MPGLIYALFKVVEKYDLIEKGRGKRCLRVSEGRKSLREREEFKL